MDSRFLSQCEKEPLSRSGAIQSHGALLVVDARGDISHVSSNLAGFLAGQEKDWIGCSLPAAPSELVVEFPLSEVAWGGNPEKPVEHHDGRLGIAPRHSFEKWVEKRMGYSRAWDNDVRLRGLRLRELLQKDVRQS